MAKTTISYWNPLTPAHQGCWQPVDNTNGLVEQLTLAIDADNGDYTRLTRFRPDADTSALGGKCHDYPEEIFIVSGRLFDAASQQWLETGHYASRPPGEWHGPFKTDVGCVVLEMSCPNQ